MTLKEAKMTIYANVVYACEKAGFSPCTTALVKDACDTVIALAEQADTPQTDDKDINVRSKDEPQKDCKKCKNYDRCKNNRWKCCVYEPKDEPQTDCETCKYGQDKHRYAHICNECGVGINNYTPQTESTGSPIGDYRDGVGAWQTDCGWK